MKNKLDKIFKAYDVRGVYPEEIDEEIVQRAGRSFVQFLQRSKQKNPPLKIVVARDNRLSSPLLSDKVQEGIMEAGADVVDIGLSPTPMFYFAVAFYGFDGGITVTSSHNPPKYNGLKFVRKGAVPVSGETGLQDIKDIILRGNYEPAEKKGKVSEKQVLEDYAQFCLKGFDSTDFPSFKIVVDTANSVSGVVISEILDQTPLNVFHLFKELDGSFPHHQPDPLKKENLESLQEEVLKQGSDLGISFDGDGDRIVFVTEKGEVVRGDILIALLADIILEESPHRKIMYDITASRVVKDTIQQNGGIPLESRRGHSLIKEKMRKEDVFFAGEFSGHYYCKENYFFECPFKSLFRILKKMAETEKPLSELVAAYHEYYHSGEINFEAKNKKEVLAAVEKKFAQKGKISKIDGVKVDFEHWWFNIRPSNTEPKIRLTMEADSLSLLRKKKKQLTSFIRKVSKS